MSGQVYRNHAAVNAVRALRDRVERGPGCWRWTGNVNPQGYPRLVIGQEIAYVHRLTYAIKNAVSYYQTEHVHHKCRTKRCVRPDHLEGLTASEHAREHHAGATVCKRGHSLADSYLRSDTGARMCQTCVRERGHSYAIRDTDARRAKLTPRACQHCGSTFKPIRQDHVLCGQQCRMNRFLAKRAAALAKLKEEA